MKYHLSNIERKETSTGKALIRANIKDTQGATTENVTIWSSFPNFANLKDGDVVEGDLEIKVNGNYTNKTLNPSPTGKPVYGAPRASGSGIKAAQERKQEMVEKAQDNKELGIKVASTINKAVELAIAEYSSPENKYSLDELVIKWRAFLWNQWEKTSSDDMIPF